MKYNGYDDIADVQQSSGIYFVFCSIKPEVEKSKMAAARPGKT
jgi:hypothetical protein